MLLLPVTDGRWDSRLLYPPYPPDGLPTPAPYRRCYAAGGKTAT